MNSNNYEGYQDQSDDTPSDSIQTTEPLTNTPPTEPLSQINTTSNPIQALISDINTTPAPAKTVVKVDPKINAPVIPSYQSDASELEMQNANKEQSADFYSSAIQTSIENINGDIAYVQSLIDQINSKIPRTINDIIPGNISQTDDPKKAYIQITNKPYNILDPFNPNRGSVATGKWVIDAVLPLGQKGETGIPGPQGEPGEKGDTGIPGPQGRRGDWGVKP